MAPDIQHPPGVSLFNLNNGSLPKEDFQRYRSMIAVPTRVGSDPKPLGVAHASNKNVGRFRTDGERIRDAVDNGESARTLAGLMAVAVAIFRSNGQVHLKSTAASGKEAK